MLAQDFGSDGVAVMSFDRVDAVEWEEFEVDVKQTGQPGKSTPSRRDSAAGDKAALK